MAAFAQQEAALAARIDEAARRGERLAIAGAGSMAAIGAPSAAPRLSMRHFRGVIDHDPAEMIVVAGAGTPLAEVERTLAAQGQTLAFEPFDHAPLLGDAPGRATIGGVVAAGLGGSRRLSAGAPRDHLLGLRAVNGRAEAFVAGGRVVKNVTGYDLCKLACGSWGRLFALTEVTLRVVPAPERCLSLVLTGLDPIRAVAAMAAAMGSAAAVSCAAHRPGRDAAASQTVLRLEGFGFSLRPRRDLLAQALAAFGPADELSQAEAEAFWRSLRVLDDLPADRALWRIVAAPSAGGRIATALERKGAACRLDWAGGLVWAAVEEPAGSTRTLVEGMGGQAMLVRASPEARAAIGARSPLPAGLAALEERVRRSFDPLGVFETGRFQ